MAKAQGKVGGSSTKAKSSGRKKRSKQSTGQYKGRSHFEAGESTAESRTIHKNARDSSRGSRPSEPSKAAAITMNSINTLDVAIGVAYIVGATQIPEIGGVVIAISLGTILLLSSICSIVGYCSKSCSRVGLVGGILLGTVACLAYASGFVWALVSWESLVACFGHDQDFIADKNIAVVVVLAVLAVFESIR